MGLVPKNGPKMGQKWAKNGHFWSFLRSFLTLWRRASPEKGPENGLFFRDLIFTGTAEMAGPIWPAVVVFCGRGKLSDVATSRLQHRETPGPKKGRGVSFFGLPGPF